MKTAIFIKTYKDDLKWLGYCLESIKKYGSGISEVVIAADEDCKEFMQIFVHEVRVVYVPAWRNGYIQQQFVKLHADQYTNAEQILFVDSDCVFHTPFTPESYMRDGKPVLLKTRYGNLGGGEAWKRITESFVGWPVEFEYMRRLPWMYRRQSLINFRAMFPTLEDRLRSLETPSFSEYNALGAYIDKFEHDEYYVSDTEVWMPESVAHQFWSWSGLDNEDKKKIEGYLK